MALSPDTTTPKFRIRDRFRLFVLPGRGKLIITPVFMLYYKQGELMNRTITLPTQLFEHIAKYAGQRQSSPEAVAIEALSNQFLPQHPYIEKIIGTGGQRAVIKGTRIGIETIVGYIQVGYTPQNIADEILPHMNLAEIYGALSYYEDHREEIDGLLLANQPAAWRNRLIQQMGESNAKKLLGEF